MDNEKCRLLIQLYSAKEFLWNSKSSQYHNKSLRYDAWVEISKKMDIPIPDLKKKMTTLLASYRREKSRIAKSCRTGSATNEVYVSKWFAFDDFNFLRDKDLPNETLDTMSENELYYTFKMEKLELEFKEYTKGLLRDKSSVWNHFLRTSDGVHAQCKKCKKIMKCQNSTTCLHSHLKLHPIEANVERSATATSSKTQPNLLEELDENEPRKKKGKLMDIYLKKSEDDNMENIITNMTACDGLPFSIFSTSGSMRKLFSKSGYDQLPKSPNTIKKIVIEKSEQLKRDLNKEMENLKATGQKFSVSLDEWTSARNRT